LPPLCLFAYEAAVVHLNAYIEMTEMANVIFDILVVKLLELIGAFAVILKLQNSSK